MKRIYVAGPYTIGDVAQNVQNAMCFGSYLLDNGFVPFIPHLNHFLHMSFPRSREQWLFYDEEWLRLCDALVRLPGESPGADEEILVAYKMCIPVYTEEEMRLMIFRKG